LLTPYAGLTFGGSANFGNVGQFADELTTTKTFGGTAAWIGSGRLGLEVDFGTTPKFYELESENDIEFGDTNVITLMGNVLFSAPLGDSSDRGLRPYVAAGMGLLRHRVSTDDFFDAPVTSEFGINVGGGAHVLIADHFGVRGDVRYFRGLRRADAETDPLVDQLDLDNIEFWRATVGVTFRFGGQ
jgi:opacity protein-like surface antigen